MKKVFVKEQQLITVDEDELQVVEIYPGSQRPSKYNYIVFMEKGNK